jgi:hypothetical protein
MIFLRPFRYFPLRRAIIPPFTRTSPARKHPIPFASSRRNYHISEPRSQIEAISTTSNLKSQSTNQEPTIQQTHRDNDWGYEAEFLHEVNLVMSLCTSVAIIVTLLVSKHGRDRDEKEIQCLRHQIKHLQAKLLEEDRNSNASSSRTCVVGRDESCACNQSS